MITLVNGHVQNQGGIAVPNGSISLQLNIDATVNAAPGGIIPASQELIFQFDASGDLVQPALIWSNNELEPQNSSGLGTYYLVTLYDANGARINKAPMYWQFVEPDGATADISQMTAYFTGGNIIFYPIPSTGNTSFAAITSGTNTGQTLEVGNGSVLEPTGSGRIEANVLVTDTATPVEVDGSAPTHAGQLLISQPGNASAIWADPQVQGLYAAGSDIATPPAYAPPTTICPILIGAADPGGLLQNLNVDGSGNLKVVTSGGGGSSNPAASATGSAVPADAGYTGINVGGTLRGWTGLSLGSQFSATVAIVDASGNQITTFGSGTVTAQIVGHTGAFLDAVIGATKPPNVLQVGGNDGTNAYGIPLASGGGSVVVSSPTAANMLVTASIASAQTLSTVTTVSAVTAITNAVKVEGNAGGAFDAVQGAAPPANAVQVSGIAAIALPTAATATDTVVPMMDKFGRQVCITGTVRDLVGTASVQTTDSSSHTLIAAIGSTFADITFLSITNETATAAVVSLSDGTTVYKFSIAGTIGGGGPINLGKDGLPATTINTNWTVQASASATLDFVAVYEKNK